MAGEDLTITPAHRRRSSSLLQQAAGSQHNNGRQSINLLDVPEDRIPEESGMVTSSDDMEMDGLNSDDGLDDDEETGLTHAERKKRRRRKTRNTRLDERVAGDGNVKTEEERLVNASIVRNVIINALLIGFWYCCSISISVYNKWMFSKENLDFHFPLFTTSIHMVVQFSLASLILWMFPQYRPRQPVIAMGEHGPQDDATSSKPQPLMTRWFYLSRIGPCGTATALDIGLGNFSLRFITLTFFTMCKSSVLAFVLLFAFIFRLEQPTWRLSLIILVMTVGVVMMVAGETAFHAGGFVLVMTASFCSGFRWSLTQILLLRNPATNNPFSSIFFLTPVMFAALLILALPIEGTGAVVEGFRVLFAAKGVLLGVALLLFPGFLAFMMVAAEFALLKRTSVVTLSVCGIFKEVLTISAAGIVFGDELSPINISGLVVTIASIAAYNYLKYTRMKKEALKEVQEILEDDAPGALRTSPKPQDATTGHAHHDLDRQESTSALMRDSLSLATDTYDGFAKHGTANGVSHSPVKRPEDLE